MSMAFSFGAVMSNLNSALPLGLSKNSTASNKCICNALPQSSSKKTPVLVTEGLEFAVIKLVVCLLLHPPMITSIIMRKTSQRNFSQWLVHTYVDHKVMNHTIVKNWTKTWRDPRREPKREGKTTYPPVLHPLNLYSFQKKTGVCCWLIIQNDQENWRIKNAPEQVNNLL